MDTRQAWMVKSDDERSVDVGPFKIHCPFCGHPLESVAGAQLQPGNLCPCGARVVRTQPGQKWDAPPNVVVQAYQELREKVQATIVGHDEAVAQLAIMGARHLHRGGRQRALIIGPSGTGKTTLARVLGEALGCPTAVWDVGVSAEVGWSGVDSGDVFAQMYDACDRDLDRLSRAVLVCDEVDKVAIRDAEGTSRQHRLGQQKSLLGILGGGTEIRFPEDGDRGKTISIFTDAMLILGLGAFDGLPQDPTANDLVNYGWMPEFASRWPVTISLDGLDPRGLMAVLQRDIQGSLEAAKDFGYHLEVSTGALRYAAAAVIDGGDNVTPRAGVGYLTAAIDRALVRLLELGARPGTSYEIRPDDLAIPISMEQER